MQEDFFMKSVYWLHRFYENKIVVLSGCRIIKGSREHSFFAVLVSWQEPKGESYDWLSEWCTATIAGFSFVSRDDQSALPAHCRWIFSWSSQFLSLFEDDARSIAERLCASGYWHYGCWSWFYSLRNPDRYIWLHELSQPWACKAPKQPPHRLWSDSGIKSAKSVNNTIVL